MASIRKLKKDINVLTYDLLGKCYTLKHFDPSLDDAKFDEVIRKVVFLRNDLILRTNHPEADAESDDLQSHYRKVKEDLFEMLGVVEELKSSRG